MTQFITPLNIFIALVVLVVGSFLYDAVMDINDNATAKFAPYNNGQTMDFNKKHGNGKGIIDSFHDGTFTSNIGN